MSSAATQIRPKRPSKETQNRQLFRRPTKEISAVETLKKRPRRVILKRDLEKRPSKETQNRQLRRRPRKEISAVETLKKKPRRVILKRDLEKRSSKETQNRQLFRRPRKEISAVEKSKKKSYLQERIKQESYKRDIEKTTSTET